MRTIPRKFAGLMIAGIAGASIAAGAAGVKEFTDKIDQTTDGVNDVVGDAIETGAQLGNEAIAAGRSLGDEPVSDSTTSTTAASSTPGLVED